MTKLYLVCCAHWQADTITNQLAAIDRKTVYLPLMDLVFDRERLAVLMQRINTVDFVLLSSPTVIKQAQAAIVKATKPTFLTVGETSAKLLKELTKLPVIFPKCATGKKALLTEHLATLNLHNKNVLEVVGNTVNVYTNCNDVANDASNDDDTEFNHKVAVSWYYELLNPAVKQNVNWQLLTIYTRVLQAIEQQYLQKLLSNDALEGIIITSSILARWLFYLADRMQCVDLLRNCTFIITHEAIESVLRCLGANKVLRQMVLGQGFSFGTRA